MPTVIVPWQPSNIGRERAWTWVRSLLVDRHPSWQIVEATDGGEPWSKSEAIMRAAVDAPDGVLVLHDADSFTDGLAAAVEHVDAHGGWAVPHERVHRLSEAATASLLAGRQFSMQDCATRPYRGLAGGGIVVIRRADLLRVPFDPRFRGWGGEDSSFGHAAKWLIGEPWRGTTPLVHLWHPPAERHSEREGSLNNRTLQLRYLDARRREVVQHLVHEARAALISLGIAI